MGLEQGEWELVIVGGGIAGFSAAQAAARSGRFASILLVSDEDRPPYRRTKISKYLARGFGREELQLAEQGWYASARVTLATGRRVESLNPARHTLSLEPGGTFSWKHLILATGAEPVPPLLAPKVLADPRVRLVRTALQVETLRSDLAGAGTVLVVGGGVLGVEIAEQVRLMGKRVLLASRGDQLMPKQLNRTAASMLEALLAGGGVEVRMGEPVRGAEVRAGRLLVELSGGAAAPDEVVFCIGTRPRTALAAAAGLEVRRGIVVDECLRTSHPDVYAAGDCAEHPGGTLTGLWHAAEHQGALAALNAAGTPCTHGNPPFRLKCEVFGGYFFSMNVPPRGRREQARRLEDRSAALYRCLYLEEDQVCAAIMVNDRPRAELYKQAVLEGWPRSRAEQELGIPSRG